MSDDRISKKGSLVARGALALGIAALAFVVGQSSLAMALAEKDPARAAALDPGNAVALSNLALAQLAAEGVDAERLEAVGEMSAAAVLADPTLPLAAVGIGLARGQRDGEASMRTAFGYADSLSRRELATNIWLIEEATARGAISEAMRHYDTAMRTSRNSKTLLFPRLLDAMEQPGYIQPLAETLSRNPAWRTDFLQHAAQNADDLPALASLLTGLKQLGSPATPLASATSIDRFAALGDYAGAWNLFAALEPDAARQHLRNGAFAVDADPPTPFDWTFVDENGVIAEPQVGDRGTSLFFSAPMDWAGQVAHQTLRLAPGRHSLSGTVYETQLNEEERPYMSLACAGSREDQRFDLPRSDADGRAFVWEFVVPSDCRFQTLSIVLQAGNTPEGVQGMIADLRITR